MKRALLVLVCMSSAIKANEMSDTWNQLSEYRVVSGVKAAAVGAGAVKGAQVFWKTMLATREVLADNHSSLFAWDKEAWEKWNKVIGNAVTMIGVAYVTKRCGWDYFPMYIRHAFAIK